MKEKRIEKYLQTRYKRELERYLNRLVNFAKQEEGDKESFRSYEKRVREKLQEAEKRDLHSEYYTMLERFVEMVGSLAEGEEEMEDIRNRILHEANRIRKAKRKRSYNRKSGQKEFDEEF